MKKLKNLICAAIAAVGLLSYSPRAVYAADVNGSIGKNELDLCEESLEKSKKCKEKKNCILYLEGDAESELDARYFSIASRKSIKRKEDGRASSFQKIIYSETLSDDGKVLGRSCTRKTDLKMFTDTHGYMMNEIAKSDLEIVAGVCAGTMSIEVDGNNISAVGSYSRLLNPKCLEDAAKEADINGNKTVTEKEAEDLYLRTAFGRVMQ